MTADPLSDALHRARDPAMKGGELIALANQLQAGGLAHAVADVHRAWIETHQTDPLLHAIYFNYAVILGNSGDQHGAKRALRAAIHVNPNFIPPYINLGGLMERMGAVHDGLNHWYQVVNMLHAVTGENLNYKTTALKQIGRVLERYNIDENAEQALLLSLELNPNQSDVAQHWVSLRQRQCKWPVVSQRGTPSKTQILSGISSLSLGAHTDDPLFQLGNAGMYAKTNIGRPARSFVQAHENLRKSPPGARRKIGYLSSDLRDHAIGYLTAEMYGLHDRSKFEIFLYYCGHAVTDAMQERIKNSAEHWVDLEGLSDEQAGERMVADGIEILVDVNGYTNGARLKMLAMRPAPIIVNWLGFPGSLGTPSHNYIIADDFIIPPEYERYYCEKVLRLPCYQPNDRQRVISDKRPTRTEAGLPEDAFVFCCFNGVHKITPFTWSRWMTIMKQVPGSVLWLLDSIQSVADRLRSHAEAHGVDPGRIYFAPKARNADHLARYPLADLFLDTSPYGAHTTCSDALWMGVPVVTLAGRSFAARVCGSLVRSAGIGELVCETPEAFVALAVELANDKDKLARYRRRLEAVRDTSVLFDTPRLVRNMEKLFEGMWADFLADRVPRPDLSNLDVYNEIGIELDNNDVEMLTVKDYDGLYLQKLAERHAFNYLRPDKVLWTPEAMARPPQPAPVQISPRPAPPVETAADLYRAAVAEAGAGRMKQAARLIERCMGLEPDNADVLDLGARIGLATGKLDAAEAFARRAVQVKPVVNMGLTLAEVMKAKGNLQTAADFFLSILSSQPKEMRALTGMGEIYEQSGRRAEAIDCYRAALELDPGNTQLAITYSGLLPSSELAQGLAALTRAAPPSGAALKTRLSYLNHFAMYKEWAERAARGLMPYHATALDDAFFHFAAPERDEYGAVAEQILAQDPADLDALGAKAAVLLSRGERLASEPVFAQLAALRTGTVFENAVFNNGVYRRFEGMPEDDILRNLPPVQEVVAAKFTKKPIVFLSCNERYFTDFARPMLLSLDAHAAKAQVHLHLMDAAENEIATVRKFVDGLENTAVAISAENPGLVHQDLMAARGYYHAVRFIRFYQRLKQYDRPLWMMDVDALINRDLTPMLAALKGADVALRARPARWEPWNQFNASVFGVSPTDAGLRYVRMIAAFVSDFYNVGRLRWGIDQLAMFGVHEYLKDQGRAPVVRFLNDREVDYDCFDDGFVWCNSGKGKFSQLEAPVKFSQKPAAESKYSVTLRTYLARLN